MIRRIVTLILVLLTLTGCAQVKTDTSTTQSQKTVSDNEQRIPSSVIPPTQTKQEDQGYLPSPFTIKDRQEIEETIREYFNDLNRKDFASAYDLWASPGISREEFIFNYNNMEIEYVRITSLKGYTVSQQNVVKYVNGSVPTPLTSVVFDIKSKEPFPTMFFPSVKKDPTGSWKIYGLGTSPLIKLLYDNQLG
ncbi:MAG: hypothetical protein M0Z55_04210 [Peptococcaceae bacterium]|nr:hypothetical protein [Peptococcaceae bacterium]